ncbi:phospholipase [Pendulispora rubella]|uniref:Phospholipase n=1 Tax=Pendulispora rubella TaxID=2741070 RepID=A0ABZ2KX57_9BACT
MKESTVAGLKVRWTGGDDGHGGGEGPLVILLHGYGAPGDDLVPLSREIPAPPGTRFAFPEAPKSLGPQFDEGRAWWDIDIMAYQFAVLAGRTQELTESVPEGLTEVRARVTELLTEVSSTAKGGPVVFGGFSQGAMVSLDVTLHCDVPLSGLALLSGTIIARQDWIPRLGSRRGLRVLQSHGTQDPILPYEVAEELRGALQAAGLEVTWVPFRGGHGIPPGAFEGLGSLLGGHSAKGKA